MLGRCIGLDGPDGIPPVYDFCEQQGAEVHSLEGLDGQMHEMCVWPDGRMAEIWPFYRGEVTPRCPDKMVWDVDNEVCIPVEDDAEQPDRVPPSSPPAMHPQVVAVECGVTWLDDSYAAAQPYMIDPITEANIRAVQTSILEEEGTEGISPGELTLIAASMIDGEANCDWDLFADAFGGVLPYGDLANSGALVQVSAPAEIVWRALAEISREQWQHHLLPEIPTEPAPTPWPAVPASPVPGQGPYVPSGELCPTGYFYDALHEVCCPDGFHWSVSEQTCRPGWWGSGRAIAGRRHMRRHRAQRDNPWGVFRGNRRINAGYSGRATTKRTVVTPKGTTRAPRSTHGCAKVYCSQMNEKRQCVAWVGEGCAAQGKRKGKRKRLVPPKGYAGMCRSGTCGAKWVPNRGQRRGTSKR